MMLLSICLLPLFFLAINFLAFYKERSYRDMLLSHYVELMAILERAKESAYRKVFRDRVLVHTTSGYMINKNEMQVIQKEYLHLVLLGCGSNVAKDLERLYGDIDSLSIILASEFIERVSSDELVVMNEASETIMRE